MTTAFLDDVIFPPSIAAGSTGGPDWPADIVELSSGHEERNTHWSAPLRYYDARYGVRSRDDLYEIVKLYHVAMGRLRGFRLLDWSDYRSGAPLTQPAATDQPLGTGDGETTTFEMKKQYKIDSHVFERRINKPYGTTLIAADGTPLTTGFTVNTATGVVTFDSAPGVGVVLTWGGQFHVPVRFDTRLDGISLSLPDIGDIPSITLKELRL